MTGFRRDVSSRQLPSGPLPIMLGWGTGESGPNDVSRRVQSPGHDGLTRADLPKQRAGRRMLRMPRRPVSEALETSGLKAYDVCDYRGVRAVGRAAENGWMVQTNDGASGPKPIVVGVNGALASYRHALVFAAQEARLRNSAIRLVHGCEPLPTLTERQPSVPLVARERQARRQLRDAVEALRPLLDAGATVEFRIDPRTGVDALLDESAAAELIVLQRRELTILGRTTDGSTSNAVAARANCPVVVVHAGHGSRHDRSGILVGLDDQMDPEDALLLAFQEASARRLAADGGPSDRARRRCPKKIALGRRRINRSPGLGSVANGRCPAPLHRPQPERRGQSSRSLWRRC